MKWSKKNSPLASVADPDLELRWGEVDSSAAFFGDDIPKNGCGGD